MHCIKAMQAAKQRAYGRWEEHGGKEVSWEAVEVM